MSLRRLACYGSVLSVIIFGVVFMWTNNCDNSDCLLSYAAVLDAVGGKVSCYDRSQNVPTQDEDEEGLRLYNCPTARFSDVPLQSTALASMPGSGNTWLRHLIQKATGIYTGSVYHDVALEKAGFLGESVIDSRVIVIKTHRDVELLKYDRAILIIRDPYDAIVSEYNWRVCGNHIGRANSHVYNTSE
ncbi:hypothetical protein LSAT2_012910 [Lamellibrachia satsuma]|nr:hypothetical protein LSAT2_012910 [Lamellibrachia satsuma]